MLKETLRRSLNAAGFQITRSSVNMKELQQHATMRRIHAGDAREIEALYQRFVFPDLVQREGRAELLYDLIGTSIGAGMYIIYHLNKSLAVAGDICEFGVAQGATSKLLAAEIRHDDQRSLWLFDSFEGLPAPAPQDKMLNDIFALGSIESYKGTMISPPKEVIDKLVSIGFPLGRTKIKKGWVKDTLRQGKLPERIAFAYVDMDFYEPVRDALYFIHDRMPVGGSIIVDDYGWFSEGAQIAVDEFIVDHKNSYTLEKPIECAGKFVILRKA